MQNSRRPNLYTRQAGFTLIELLIVISILVLLSTAIFVGFNPSRRLADSRNAKRGRDINSILTAIDQYVADNGGNLPPGLTTNMTPRQIGSCTTGGSTLCAGAATACVNLTTPLAPYLVSIPVDPRTGSAATTGYSIRISASNQVTIQSCSAENSVVLSVSR
jgi:prepilin-type N-terminal cleavage/methylation domain-containing protein